MKVDKNTRVLILGDETFKLINSYDECPIYNIDAHGDGREGCNLGREECPNQYHSISMDCPLPKLIDVIEDLRAISKNKNE